MCRLEILGGSGSVLVTDDMVYRITIKAEDMVKHHELSKLLEIPWPITYD